MVRPFFASPRDKQICWADGSGGPGPFSRGRSQPSSGQLPGRILFVPNIVPRDGVRCCVYAGGMPNGVQYFTSSSNNSLLRRTIDEDGLVDESWRGDHIALHFKANLLSPRSEAFATTQGMTCRIVTIP